MLITRLFVGNTMKDTPQRRIMPFSNLDAKDSGILKMLNDDSRATTQAIADALGMPRVTVSFSPHLPLLTSFLPSSSSSSSS